MCIPFKNNFDYKINKVKKDNKGIFIAVDLKIEGEKTLINIYAPKEDCIQFTSLSEKLEELKNDTVIITGDFNQYRREN